MSSGENGKGMPTSQAGIRDEVGETHCECRICGFLGGEGGWSRGKRGEKEGNKVGGRPRGKGFFLPFKLGASKPRDSSGDGAWSSRCGASAAGEPLRVWLVELSRSIAMSPSVQLLKLWSASSEGIPPVCTHNHHHGGPTRFNLAHSAAAHT
jgi:hypothetical protein